MAKQFIVIQDSREQKPWIFEPEEKVSGKCQLIGTEIIGLPAGDYSVKGLEDKIIIESKNGFSELFGNLCNKENKERFERELEKLRSIKHKYILIETGVSKDSLGLGIPQMGKWAPPASKIYKCLLEYEMEYGVIFKFVGDAGQKIARYIFESMVKKYV